MGITHGWTTIEPDDPTKDVSQRNLNDHFGTAVDHAATAPFTTNTVLSLWLEGDPSGGTFRLTWNGQQTGTIAWDATPAVVQAALEGLSNIGIGDVDCSAGDLPTDRILIEFTGALAGVAQNVPTVSDNSLTGGSAPQPQFIFAVVGGPPTLAGVAQIGFDSNFSSWWLNLGTVGTPVWVTNDGLVHFDPATRVITAEVVADSNLADMVTWRDDASEKDRVSIGGSSIRLKRLDAQGRLLAGITADEDFIDLDLKEYAGGVTVVDRSFSVGKDRVSYGSDFRVLSGGAVITGQNTAPADGDLNASEVALWFDATDGAAKLKIKGKSANGTVVTGEVALT
jgi:hypothetical protein